MTICTHDRSLLFDDPELRSIVEEEWIGLFQRFPGARPDCVVIMPNHIHFVIWLESEPPGPGASPAPTSSNSVGAEFAGVPTNEPVGAPLAGAPASRATSLQDIVGAFKSRIAVRWLRRVKEHEPERSAKIWQRSFYDRIIRNDAELDRVRAYIADNPAQWAYDYDNPDHVLNAAYGSSWDWLERRETATVVLN